MSKFKQLKTPEILFIDDCDTQYNLHKLFLNLNRYRKFRFYSIRIGLLLLSFLGIYGILQHLLYKVLY